MDPLDFLNGNFSLGRAGAFFSRQIAPPRLPDTVRDNRSDYEAHEGRMQTGRRAEYAGSKLKPPTTWEGAAWKASLAAVLGKPAVRNDRGDRGNVGIIRSPVRASILPDALL